MLSALRLLRALENSGQRLVEAKKIMTVLPQVLRSARVPNEKKAKAMSDEDVLAVCSKMEAQLADRGRILVRASGTEPLIRVMIEGENVEEIGLMADQITELIVSRYGA